MHNTITGDPGRNNRCHGSGIWCWYNISGLHKDLRDKNPHKHLLEKLWGYGIRRKIYSWIKAFLKNRTQRVAVNGCFSSYEKVTSGIPQVSVFGPILFVNYINDLPYVIQVMMRMYADDSKILRRLNTPDHVNQVQVSVNQSVIWASIWQMFYHYKNATIYT